MRNMVTQLFKHEKIMTTVPKAKELRRHSDRIVSLAKRGDMHAKRQAHAFVYEADVVKKIFEEYPRRYARREGGYTRILQLDKNRKGDGAPMCFVHMMDAPGLNRSFVHPGQRDHADHGDGDVDDPLQFGDNDANKPMINAQSRVIE
jgi:large subunit ribosomal protein L17